MNLIRMLRHDKRVAHLVLMIFCLFILVKFIVKHKHPDSKNTTQNVEKPYVFAFEPINSSISCFSSFKKNKLPLIDTKSIKKNSIFFHETSCKGALSSREACTIEVAVRNNPSKTIYVIFHGPVDKDNLSSNTALAKLMQFRNIQIGRIYLNEHAKGTPAEQFLSTYESLDNGSYCVYNAAMITQLITLYKYGGISLDLDMMAVKPLKVPRNFVAMEDCNNVGAAIMGFDTNEGKNFTKAAIEYFLRNFNPNTTLFASNVTTEVTKKLCSIKNFNVTKECGDIQIFPSGEFYPYTRTQYLSYFKLRVGTEDKIDPQGYHLWNHQSRNTVNLKTSLYNDIAKVQCPKIYKFYGEHFGF